MGNLVLPQYLIKYTASGQTIDLDVLFRRLNCASLFECVVARATSLLSADAVARAFHFLGVRPVRASAESETEMGEFTRWYSKRPLSSLHIDVRPVAFEPFRREMGNVYNLARTIANSEASRCPCVTVDHAARPASTAHGERMARAIAARKPPSATFGSRREPPTRPEPKTQRTTVTISTRSLFSGPDGFSRRITSPPRQRVIPYPAFQGVELGTIPSIDPSFQPPSTEGTGHALGLGDDQSESVSPRPSTQAGKSGKRVFGRELTDAVWALATSFSETSSSLVGLRKAGMSRGRIIVLTIEAVMQH